MGAYRFTLMLLTVTREGTKLFGQPEGQERSELTLASDDTLSALGGIITGRFVRDAKGKVVEMIVREGGVELIGKRIE